MEKPANAHQYVNDDFRNYQQQQQRYDEEKKKKWSLGGFFRRKTHKKDLEESSEDEDDGKKGFLQRKRSNRSKRKNRTNGFDVVVPQYNANEVLGKTAEELWSGTKEQPQQRYIFRQHDAARVESNLSRNSSGGSGSLDSRKGRREVMARAQAKRDHQMREGGSSSDDNESGQSGSSLTGRRRSRQGRMKIPSATPSPSRSPRVQPKMPLHASSSYPLPIHTYPPQYHIAHSSPHRRTTMFEYEQFLASCGKSLSYDQDMHRAEAMFVQLPIARTRSSSIQTEAHGQVPNPKPEPPPRMRPIAVNRFESTSSLPIPMIQRSCSGGYVYENHRQQIYQNCPIPNGVTKATVHYSQSPKIPQSPQTDLRYYADQNPRSRNPIHITCSPTNEQPYLSDSQLCRKSTKEFWRIKDQELLKKQQHSRSNSPAMMCVVNKPKKQTAVIVAKKIIHNIEPERGVKSPPEPPIRRHSKIDTTSNLDDALNELESIYKSLKLTEEHNTPVKENKQKPPKSPDRINDDMAVRRLAIKDSSSLDHKKIIQQSYMQCSPVLGSNPNIKPSSPAEPDITLDDVVYRNHRYANSALKTLDPQPPFGIPIGPVTPAPNSDYLHVNPTEKLRNSFLASKVPDIVKDDLAFRNLRKDNLTANLPIINSTKKRAVRSLSENLFNIIQKEENAFLPIETNNNDVDYDKTRSMMDLNEKKLQALKDEKMAKRAEFFQDKLKTSWSELRQNDNRQRSTSTETLTEENEKRKHFRSPVVELSKYPAAVPATALYQNPFKEQPMPLDEIQLDDLLSKIAREAKNTSEAIGKQLIELEVAVASDMLSSPERKPISKLSTLESEIRKNNVEIVQVVLQPPPETHFTSNLSKILADVEKEHSQLCQVLDEDKEVFEEILESDDDKIDVFEEVYEYNCALLKKQDDESEICVGDEVKRIAATRGNDDDDDDRGEHSRPRGANPFGPDYDAGMNRKSSELSSTASSDAERARERIERYKDRRRQEMSARYDCTTDVGRITRQERVKTDSISNKTDNTEKIVRETKASRLRAASRNNRTENEKPSTSRRESVDKSQIRKSFLNRSHTSEPTKEDGRKSASASPSSIVNGHTATTVTAKAIVRKSLTGHDNDKSSAIIKTTTKRIMMANGKKVNGNNHDEISKPSILKKKSVDEGSNNLNDDLIITRPVSILKRKTLSQDGAVTFSPSVIDRDKNRKKTQGILKKRRSLDECEVANRQRSCSPDKSILKNFRRLSMEDVNNVVHEPSHGILKRKSTTTPPPMHHVTIADTVIMAAAEALGHVQTDLEYVRPILKKKSSSEEHTPEMTIADQPRPILKKKSAEVEDVLVRPILKLGRKSFEEELPSILKKNERVRARSVCDYERAKARILPRPLSLAESGTDFHNFLRNELQWLPISDDRGDDNAVNVNSTDVQVKMQDGEPTGGKEEEEDTCSKLSFSERIVLFNNRVKETIPSPSMRRPRSARSKTQPVTDEDLVQIRPPGGIMVLPIGGLKSILKRNGSGSESSDNEVKSILANTVKFDGQKNLAKILQNVNQAADDERCASSLVKSQSHASVTNVFKPNGENDETIKLQPDEKEIGGGLRRSTTQPLGHLSSKDEVEDMSGKSIKERLAKLRQSGEIGWQKRNIKLKNQDAVTTGNYLQAGENESVLALRLDQLDNAREGWKTRVPQTDAVKFTVEGKMGIASPAPVVSTPVTEKKRSPKQIKFRSKNFIEEMHSSPASPSTAPLSLMKRSFSAPGGEDLPTTPPPIEGPIVNVPKTDDETFDSFFSTIIPSTIEERLDINLEDLDVVRRTESRLLVQRRSVQVQRRRRTARNPVKSLALREDLLDAYMEVKTGVAEKELKRIKGGNQLAQEALDGLASTEDFTAVNLKRPTIGPVQYPDVMLLRIKGRRHVETRLVEPIPSSVNNGDCFIAVTRNTIALFMGELSNVVEKARAKEIAARIETGELSCTAGRISGQSRFWAILGSENEEAEEAGPPDEDEKIESFLSSTNMVYELINHELVPLSCAWGIVPKVEILQSTKNLVFDFGSEMYVWSGKCASLAGRREVAILAKELWEQGYDYTECDWSPFGSTLIGQRPKWALLCKITQNMEPVIFREKFQDWPDEALVAKLSGITEPDGSSIMEIKSCNAEDMVNERLQWPDLELEGTHLGRGVNYLDEETRRLSEISDIAITVWRVSEANQCEITDLRDFGQFCEDSSYVIRWHYSVSITVRGLNGAPSRFSAPGRDRFAYFLWHGQRSSLGDRGAAALHTVTLDTESAPQVVVNELAEPPAFLRLFKGCMGIHSGSSSEISLYLIRGSELMETMMIQVEPNVASLRSRACFIIINRNEATVTLWCGSQATQVTKDIGKKCVDNLINIRPNEFNLPDLEIAFKEEEEGNIENLGLNGKIDDFYGPVDGTPVRLFQFTNTRGVFEAIEISSPLLHPNGSFPYLFLQSDLYNVSQPGLFLMDAGDKLWLWHGWNEPDAATSVLIRHQAQRRAAMQTAMNYWQHSRHNTDVNGSLVWAGLEPQEFIALFPFWHQRDDLMESGREKGEIVDMETELQRLMCMRYPLAVLLQRPLPDGVDPTVLEDYLEPDAFPELFEMTRQEFMQLPAWKKSTLKKDVGLF